MKPNALGIRALELRLNQRDAMRRQAAAARQRGSGRQARTRARECTKPEFSSPNRRRNSPSFPCRPRIA
jgi:hypothetical protein